MKIVESEVRRNRAKPQRCVIVGRDNAGAARKFFAALKGMFAAG